MPSVRIDPPVVTVPLGRKILLGPRGPRCCSSCGEGLRMVAPSLCCPNCDGLAMYFMAVEEGGPTAIL